MRQKERINTILGTSNYQPEEWWGLIIEENESSYSSALEIFIDLIHKNIARLNTIGVLSGDITFWYMYEYNEQCIWNSGRTLQEGWEN